MNEKDTEKNTVCYNKSHKYNKTLDSYQNTAAVYINNNTSETYDDILLEYPILQSGRNVEISLNPRRDGINVNQLLCELRKKFSMYNLGYIAWFLVYGV